MASDLSSYGSLSRPSRLRHLLLMKVLLQPIEAFDVFDVDLQNKDRDSKSKLNAHIHTFLPEPLSENSHYPQRGLSADLDTLVVCKTHMFNEGVGVEA
jgi:hypothetical protein